MANPTQWPMSRPAQPPDKRADQNRRRAARERAQAIWDREGEAACVDYESDDVRTAFRSIRRAENAKAVARAEGPPVRGALDRR